MKIELNNNNINIINKKNIDTLIIGSFDGIHKGHYKLFNKANKYSILLIKNVPSKTKYIYSWNERIKDINLCLNPQHILYYDLKKQNISAMEFINLYLNKLKIKKIIVGSDFHFGNDKKDITFLKKHISSNIKIIVVNRSKNSISTSKIKNYILNGKIELANKYLINKYNIISQVVVGKKIASNILGCPTANIKINNKRIIPMPGIYITKTILNNCEYTSITFIGKSKTFKSKYVSIETHLNDYQSDNFYGKKIKVIFFKKIANVKFYKNINNLKDDIQLYISKSKKYFN